MNPNIEQLTKLGEECGLQPTGYVDENGMPDFIGEREDMDKYFEIVDGAEWSLICGD